MQGELSVRHYAESALGWPSNDFGINLVNTTGKALRLIPDPRGSQCVENNASVFRTNPNRIVELRVSRRNSREKDGCTVDVSAQEWTAEFTDGTEGKWSLAVDAEGEDRSVALCSEGEQARVFVCTPAKPESQGDPVATIGIAPR